MSAEFTQGATERQTSEDTVTVLTTRGPFATKMVRWRRHPDDGTGEWVITDYDDAKTFSIVVRNVGTIYELSAILAEIEQNPRSLIVRGELAEGVDLAHAYRRLHPREKADGTLEPATLRAVARHWVPLDIDSIPCPEWLDPVHERDRTVNYVVSQLPQEFHGATCWWSFTSGQGIKPGIRIRLFFWADRALADWELKAWLGERVPTEGVPPAKWPAKYPVDPAIFAPAQPIYVARPIVVGAPDPVPIRSGIWRGDRDAITPPTITKPEKVATVRKLSDRQSSSTYYDGSYETHRSRIGGYEGSGYEAHRGRIGDDDGGDGFYGPVKSAVAAYIARHGAGVETEWLRTDLERAIREASRDPRIHDDAYVEFRVRDLDTLIPAIVELQSVSEAARLDVEESEPTYPAPSGSVVEARDRLAQVARQHVASVIAYAAAKAEYRVRLKEWEGRQAPAA